MIRAGLVIGGLLLVLGVANLQIVQKERLLRDGDWASLALAPVDPRSLIQGDYMALDYAIARQVQVDSGWPRDGQLVVAPDADGVARFVRRHQAATPLAPGERLLQDASVSTVSGLAPSASSRKATPTATLAPATAS